MISFCYNNLTRGSAVFAARGFDLHGVHKYARVEIEIGEVNRYLIGVLLFMVVNHLSVNVIEVNLCAQ